MLNCEIEESFAKMLVISAAGAENGLINSIIPPTVFTPIRFTETSGTATIDVIDMSVMLKSRSVMFRFTVIFLFKVAFSAIMSSVISSSHLITSVAVVLFLLLVAFHDIYIL